MFRDITEHKVAFGRAGGVTELRLGWVIEDKLSVPSHRLSAIGKISNHAHDGWQSLHFSLGFMVAIHLRQGECPSPASNP